MAGTPFTSHATDAVALNRNITPVPECKVYPALQNGKLTSWFSRSTSAHLWDKKDRMPFVIRTAGQFAKLLKGSERPLIERAIAEIYHGGGIP